MTGIDLEWLKLKKLSHLYEQQCIFLFLLVHNSELLENLKPTRPHFDVV